MTIQEAYFNMPSFLRHDIPVSITDVASPMNVATYKNAALFAAPKDGTIDTIEFRLGSGASLNSASVLRVSLQDVSTSAQAQPDGTIDQYRDISCNGLDTTWIVPGLITSDGTDSGTKRTVSAGDKLAFVLEYQTFTAGDSCGLMCANVALWPGPYAFPLAVRYITSWGFPGRAPLIVIKYSDGSYESISLLNPPYKDGDGHTYNESTTYDEGGLLFQVPLEMTLQGIEAALGPSLNVGTDFDVKVYKGSSLLTSYSDPPYRSNMSAAGFRGYSIFFPDSVQLLANTDYRIVVRGYSTGTLAVALYTMIFHSETIKNTIYPSTWKLTQRVDDGSWTNTDLEVPMIMLKLGGIADTLAVAKKRANLFVVT